MSLSTSAFRCTGISLKEIKYNEKNQDTLVDEGGDSNIAKICFLGCTYFFSLKAHLHSAFPSFTGVYLIQAPPVYCLSPPAWWWLSCCEVESPSAKTLWTVCERDMCLSQHCPSLLRPVPGLPNTAVQMGRLHLALKVGFRIFKGLLHV